MAAPTTSAAATPRPISSAGIALVDAVAVAAEAAGHHPDIDIRWRDVLFVLATHSEGGVTAKDIELAAQIDAPGAGGVGRRPAAPD